LLILSLLAVKDQSLKVALLSQIQTALNTN